MSTGCIVELARSGRSSCKKCKDKIAEKSLRVGRSYEDGDGRKMTSWYHPACWPVPKAMACLDEVEGWDALSDEHKEVLIARAGRNKAPKAGSSTTAGAAGAATATAAAVTAGSSTATTAGGGGVSAAGGAAGSGPLGDGFCEFVSLCDRVASDSGSGAKTAIISAHLRRLRGEARYLTVKLLLPGKQHDHRVYQLKDKSLLSQLSSILRVGEQQMKDFHETSTDVGATAQRFYEKSSFAPPQPPPRALSLADVDCFLDGLASSSATLGSIVPRCTPVELRTVLRLVSKDLRVGGGSAVVLKALGPAAYEQYKAQPGQLRAIVEANTGGGDGGGGPSGAGPAAATAVAAAQAGASGERRAAVVDDDVSTDDDDDPAAAAPVAGEWQVLLGRKFQPYDAAVQEKLEAAYTRDDDSVEVELRGSDYVLRLKELRQELKSDPGRWRAIRRVPKGDGGAPAPMLVD